LPEVPDKWDLLGRLLVWVGTPLVFVSLLISLIAIIDWIRFAKSSVRLSQDVGNSVLDILGSGRVPARRYVVQCMVAVALLLATSYSIVQLAQVVVSETADHGGSYSTEAVLDVATGYDRWEPISQGVLLIEMSLLAAAFAAALLGSLSTVRSVTTPLAWISMSGGGSGVLVLIAGLAVFGQAQAGEPGYTVDVSYLYIAVALLLFIWSFALYKFADLCDSLRRELSRARLLRQAPEA
jgi:hypothetical protein